MKMNYNKKEERLELGEEKRQTTQRWVETAMATEKSTNTIVKHRQKHSFLIIRETTGFEIDDDDDKLYFSVRSSSWPCKAY